MNNKAFTLVEILIVVVILGVLAAVVIPKFATANDDARTSAVILGEDPYPSLAQLEDGTVLKFDVPVNPFTSVAGIQSVGLSQAQARGVSNTATVGWNYYVDNSANPPIAVFYANTTAPTTAPDGSGGTLSANDL